ncbi:hypothetical protein RJT34_32385 [Clitoria ternatea]|uniref:Uncharacterized protein n=1 Tax=Clitoria ternatea TaxID=43366 RepID=A0AAN9I5V5_CLITE
MFFCIFFPLSTKKCTLGLYAELMYVLISYFNKRRVLLSPHPTIKILLIVPTLIDTEEVMVFFLYLIHAIQGEVSITGSLVCKYFGLSFVWLSNACS